MADADATTYKRRCRATAAHHERMAQVFDAYGQTENAAAARHAAERSYEAAERYTHAFHELCACHECLERLEAREA